MGVPSGPEAWRGGTQKEIYEFIRKVLQATAAPGSWALEGGSGVGEGTLELVGGQLVVRQTAAGHQQVARALAGLRAAGRQGLVVEARWVRCDAAGREAMMLKPADRADGRLVDTAALAKAATPWRAQLTAMNGQQAYVTAGRGYTAITGYVPTVEENVCSMQPVLSRIRWGVLLEAKGVLEPDGRRVQLNVNGVIARPRSEQAPRMVTNPVEVTPLDYDIQECTASLNVPVGQWVLAGGCTVPGREKEKGKEKDEQVYLVVRVEATGG